MFDWITGFIESTGYFGIALLTFLENVFPPIPSELIVPLAGFTASEGKLNIVLVVFSGTIGSVAGALIWYYVGRWIGGDRLKRLAARHGRWFTLSPSEVDQAQAFFERHCAKAVFIGRLIPAVRTLISVPAGITRMRLSRFLAWTALGGVLWTALLAGAGYLLQNQYTRVADYLNPATNVILGLILVFYLYRVVTFRGEKAR